MSFLGGSIVGVGFVGVMAMGTAGQDQTVPVVSGTASIILSSSIATTAVTTPTATVILVS